MNNSYPFVREQTQLSLPSSANALPIQLIRYDINQYNDSLYPSLKIELPSESQQWVTKRKAQFLAGRIAAKNALQTISADNKTIHIGEHREPLWGNKIIGSISHSDGLSIAIAQFQTSSNQGIGLDIQTILNDQEINDSANAVLTANDEIFLKKEIHAYSYNQLFTLLFSAKESFFKAVFNDVGHHFDFDAVSLKSVDYDSRTLLLKCEKTISDNIVSGSEYLIYFTQVEAKRAALITYCVFSSP